MRGAPLTAAMSVCLVLAILPLAAFPALIPTFTAEWRISNTQAGWISGIYFFGYMATVPFLMSATDRVDARWVYFGGTALSAAATFAFAWLVHDFWSALVLRTIAGIGLAGTYMPGLKVLTDRITGNVSRAVAAYTACFSVGSGFSFLLAGSVSDASGWRLAFVACALGPLAALALTAALLRARPTPTTRSSIGLLAGFRQALGNRAVVGYILAYSTHNFEALAMRGWVVSLLVFAAARTDAQGFPWSPTEIATALTVLGLPGTILGNELAMRIGRNRAIIFIMLTSAGFSAAVAGATDAPYWLLVTLVLLHGMSIPADAGAIVAGTVDAAASEVQGASLALQASAGFGASFLGPLVVGVVLDHTGGAASAIAWRWAFLSIAGFACLGPFAIRLAKRRVSGAQPAVKCRCRDGGYRRRA